MWRVKVTYFHPVVEFEDECFFDFLTDLEAWRFHELAFKAHNVLSITKPQFIKL